LLKSPPSIGHLETNRIRTMTEKNITKLTIILSAGLFMTALTQTAYCTTDCKGSFMVFLAGILGVLTEIGAVASFMLDTLNGHSGGLKHPIGAAFTWLANPILLFSYIIFSQSKKTAFILSIVSTLIILSFTLFDKVIDNSAGHYKTVTALNLGYWLWLLSSLTIVLGSLIILKKSRKRLLES